MNEVKKVVIAGGGTAGWLAAAGLSKKLGKLLDITLVESDAIGTIGVGEATIPPMQLFHKLLGIDEQAFMRATEATFKLGIQFENWGKVGDNYIHSFGKTGKEAWLANFVHFWLHGKSRGIDAEYGDYCYELKAARENKFAKSANTEINYAYHLDATLYAKFLRKFSEEFGLQRIEGKISSVSQNADTGYIESLTLESGQIVEGDLFIDCTGFRGLLIEETLKTGYEEWQHWLPCDTAVAVQTESTGPAVPYTRSIAHDWGWQWRIPLQHRVGNGMVFSSQHVSEDEVTKTLLANIEGEMLTEPRVIRYKTGRRLKVWNKNCIAMGLSSGFVEPLESTSIHLFMMSITRLMQLFPFGGINESCIDEFNNQSTQELEKIRDFIILHYHATQREDSSFWRYCKNMEVPQSLAHRMDLFQENAHAFQHDGELFRVDSWTQVMLGQGIMPKQHHFLPQQMNDADLKRFLSGIKDNIDGAVSKLPQHIDFINQYCSST